MNKRRSEPFQSDIFASVRTGPEHAAGSPHGNHTEAFVGALIVPSAMYAPTDWRNSRFKVVLTLGVMLLAACRRAGAQDQGASFAPPSASTVSGRIDAIFNFELALSAAIAAGVCLCIIIFCIKYRHGVKANRQNPPLQSTAAEAAWILTPLALAFGTYVWASKVFYDMYKPPPESIVINVVAKQWMWKLQHPEGQREINELHIPVGRPVRLLMTSQDVIHSFFVPAFRIKQDVLPGRTTETWFQATKAGRYHLLCSQFCGMDHSHMTGWVDAMEPADYARWLTRTQGEPTMAAEGAKLYLRLGCSGCHGASNTVRAPSLDGIYGKPVPLEDRRVVIADDRYLHDSILLPKQEIAAGYKPVMPSFSGQITEDQTMELVAYIRSLGQRSGREDPRLPSAGNSAERTREQQQNVRERTRQEKNTDTGGITP